MEHQSAESLFERGRVAYVEGHRQDACELFRNALKACGPEDGQPLRAAIHVETGRVARDLGDNESASSHYRTAAEFYRGFNDPMNLAHALRHAADISRQMDRFSEAEPCILEAIEIYRAQRPLPQLHLANALRVAALLLEQAGKPAEALPLWLEARDNYRAAGVEAGMAESRAHMATAGRG